MIEEPEEKEDQELQAEPFDGANPRHVKKAKMKAKQRERLKSIALARLMSNPAGRILMWDLLTACRTYMGSFNLDRPDALTTIYFEGRRSIGNKLILDINRTCPEQYPIMCAENQPEKTL